MKTVKIIIKDAEFEFAPSELRSLKVEVDTALQKLLIEGIRSGWVNWMNSKTCTDFLENYK